MKATPSDPRIRAAAHATIATACHVFSKAVAKSERAGEEVKGKILARLKALETRHMKAALLLAVHVRTTGMPLDPPSGAEVKQALAPMCESLALKMKRIGLNSVS